MVNTEIKGYSFITEIITEGKSSSLLTEVKSESSNFVTEYITEGKSYSDSNKSIKSRKSNLIYFLARPEELYMYM